MSRTVGIEVEFTGSRADALAKLQEIGLARADSTVDYNNRDREFWVMKTDSSVRDGGEMVSPILDFDKPDDRAQVNAAFKVLKEIGAKTSHTAGIHVHVGLDGLSDDEIGMIAKFAVKYEDFLYRIGASGWQTIRANWERYCKPYGRDMKQAMVAGDFSWAVVGGQTVHEHYVNLSMSRNRTAEFRHFNSSLSGRRAQAYMALCVAIVKAVRYGKVQRAVNRYNSFPLGGMKEGWRDETRLLNSVLRTISCSGHALHPVDRKNIIALWGDSKPQDSVGHKYAIPDWVRAANKESAPPSLSVVVGDEELTVEEADDRPGGSLLGQAMPGRNNRGLCTQCGNGSCTCCRYCGYAAASFDNDGVAHGDSTHRYVFIEHGNYTGRVGRYPRPDADLVGAA